MRAILTIVSLLISATSALGQDGVANINVYSQCDKDSVGRQVSYYLKEAIRKSYGYRLVEEYAKAGYQISLVCADPDANDVGVRTIFSYSFVVLNFRPKGYYDYQLTHGVYRCGSGKVESCAKGLMASFDDEVSKMKKRIIAGDFDPF